MPRWPAWVPESHREPWYTPVRRCWSGPERRAAGGHPRRSTARRVCLALPWLLPRDLQAIFCMAVNKPFLFGATHLSAPSPGLPFPGHPTAALNSWDLAQVPGRSSAVPAAGLLLLTPAMLVVSYRPRGTRAFVLPPRPAGATPGALEPAAGAANAFDLLRVMRSLSSRQWWLTGGPGWPERPASAWWSGTRSTRPPDLAVLIAGGRDRVVVMVVTALRSPYRSPTHWTIIPTLWLLATSRCCLGSITVRAGRSPVKQRSRYRTGSAGTQRTKSPASVYFAGSLNSCPRRARQGRLCKWLIVQGNNSRQELAALASGRQIWWEGNRSNAGRSSDFTGEMSNFVSV